MQWTKIQRQIEDLREVFVSRLRGSIESSATDTPLEKEMSKLRQGLLAGDEEKGNGGAETLETLIDFFYHPIPPREGYGTVRDYLNYRLEDIGSRLDPRPLPPSTTPF